MRYHRRHRAVRQHILGPLLKFGIGLVVLSLLAITAIPSLISRGSRTVVYEPARIVVYTDRQLAPIEAPWANLAQGGEAHDWRLQPVAQQVRALDVEYIRLDHLYDFYDIVGGSPGNLSFDFSKLDVMLDDIAAAGALPYLSLSYMPPAISKGDIVDEPHSYADWQLVVQRTIEHVSGTRGIPNVYYEVWNEPDLFGGWKYYGSKNYLHLYAASARGAQNAQVSQPFKIGGPATTGLYGNWIKALAKLNQQDGLPLDFISWHRYATDIEQFRFDVSTVRSWLNQYPELQERLEYHITEWGHDSENHPGYDSQYSAAHLAAAAIEMEGVIDKAFAFEIQDGLDPNGQAYWGRWGMLTHQDHGSYPKPRYHVFQFIRRHLQGTQLQTLGKGTYVKAMASEKADGTISVLLANFDPAATNQEIVPVTLKNLSPGTYSLTKQLYGHTPSTNQFTLTQSQDFQASFEMRPLSVVVLTITKTQ